MREQGMVTTDFKKVSDLVISAKLKRGDNNKAFHQRWIHPPPHEIFTKYTRKPSIRDVNKRA